MKDFKICSNEGVLFALGPITGHFDIDEGQEFKFQGHKKLHNNI